MPDTGRLCTAFAAVRLSTFVKNVMARMDEAILPQTIHICNIREARQQGVNMFAALLITNQLLHCTLVICCLALQQSSMSQVEVNTGKTTPGGIML